MPSHTTIGHGLDPRHLYTPEAVCDILGVGRPRLRQWRREGLRHRYLGRSVFLLGEDVIDFVLANSSGERWDTKN